MEQTPIKVTNAFITNALRQCGYTTYTAICDIIDNSIDKDVNSSEVHIKYEGSYSNISALLIVDNGCGMSFDTLKTALSLGAETGKTFECLGSYGVGLKTAALAIGKKLEVFSKRKEDKTVNYACIDLDDYYIYNKDITVKFEQIKSDIVSKHGTIVKISKLDKISTHSWKVLKPTLQSTIGLVYNKFIFNKLCIFKLNNDIVKPVDAIGNMVGINVEKMSKDNSHFVVNGINIKYNAWFIPSTAQQNGENWLPRSNNYCGIYLYRNNRLVGSGLSLGLLSSGGGQSKHALLNGLRIEIFMDGNADMLTGSSYLKTVNEKDKSSLNEEFANVMSKELSPFVSEAKARDRRLKEIETLPNEQKFLDNLAQALNKNIRVSIPKEKKETPAEENVQKDVASSTLKDILNTLPKEPKTKKERLQKFFKFDTIHLGENGPIVEYTDSISLNVDHIFYQDVYQNLDDNSKWALCVLFASEFSTRKQMFVDNDEHTKEIFFMYDEMNSHRMEEIVDKICPDIKRVADIGA